MGERSFLFHLFIEHLFIEHLTWSTTLGGLKLQIKSWVLLTTDQFSNFLSLTFILCIVHHLLNLCYQIAGFTPKGWCTGRRRWTGADHQNNGGKNPRKYSSTGHRNHGNRETRQRIERRESHHRRPKRICVCVCAMLIWSSVILNAIFVFVSAMHAQDRCT